MLYRLSVVIRIDVGQALTLHSRLGRFRFDCGVADCGRALQSMGGQLEGSVSVVKRCFYPYVQTLAVGRGAMT